MTKILHVSQACLRIIVPYLRILGLTSKPPCHLRRKFVTMISLDRPPTRSSSLNCTPVNLANAFRATPEFSYSVRLYCTTNKLHIRYIRVPKRLVRRGLRQVIGVNRIQAQASSLAWPTCPSFLRAEILECRCMKHENRSRARGSDQSC